MHRLGENQFLKGRPVIKAFNVIQNLKECGVEETIDEHGEILLQCNYGDKARLQSYTKDEDEIKAGLVVNWPHTHKEWQDQVKCLET